MPTSLSTYRLRIVLAAVALLALGCSAPHDNPLDPGSPRYREPTEPPDLEGCVHSLHISRTFPTGEIYQVEMHLAGADAPELDSARAIFDDLDTLRLGFLSDSSFWVANVTAATLGDPDLGAVVGKPFTFIAWRSGVAFTAGPVFLFRVIEGVPLALSPADDAVTGPYPTMTWQPFSASFPLDYLAEVFLSETVSPVWSASLPSGVSSIQVTDSLADGAYYWTITVQDEFGDYSRSREADFSVSSQVPLP